MDDLLIAYCRDCGDLIATVKLSGFRSGMCNKCAVKHRVKHTTRKCAGCDVVIDLLALPKHGRPRKKYHNHECYAAHKASKFPPLPESKVCPCGVTMTRGDLSYGNWKKKVYHDRECANVFKRKP